MKISKMLQREDFYSILEATLSHNNALLGIKGSVQVTEPTRACKLFVNPQLNAIISRHPSEAVKSFLFTEYAVSGGFVRRLAVNLYVWLSTTFVRLFAKKGIHISFDDNINVDDLLIYPCNKKIRSFNFKKGTVISCLKDGFPTTYINREIVFREHASSPFVPKVYNCMRNVAYEETIIRGVPLARVHEKEKKHQLLDKAYDIMRSFSLEQIKSVTASDYIDNLCENCLRGLKNKAGFNDLSCIKSIFTALGRNTAGKFNLVLSHGDFQPGNIWVTHDSNIVIIDWETVKERSPFYDYVALYCELRMDTSKQALYERIVSNKELSLRFKVSSDIIARVVLAEDLAYQTEELLSFPGTIGVKDYLSIINQYMNLKYD